jgi:hypothetical protein
LNQKLSRFQQKAAGCQASALAKSKESFNPNSLSSGIAWSVEYLMQRAKHKAFMELLHHI